MSERHPDPCASFGETADALNAIERALEAARNEAERICTGALDGCADADQAERALRLRADAITISGVLACVHVNVSFGAMIAAEAA